MTRRWIAVLRFDPFGDALTRDVLASQAGAGRVPRFMPMDLYKVDDHYVLTADLPGVDPGSVDVSVDNGTLTLTAHRSARSDEAVQWLSNERFSGTYRRQLSLGDGVDSLPYLRHLREWRPDREHPARRTRQTAPHRRRARGRRAHHRVVHGRLELTPNPVRGCGAFCSRARYGAR